MLPKSSSAFHLCHVIRTHCGGGTTPFRILVILFLSVTSSSVTTAMRAPADVHNAECMFVYHSFVNSTGEIWSPNYPGYYPHNTECQYLFYGRDEEKIRIEFQEFDVDGIMPGCDASTMSDYVSFSNFADAEDRKMERLCGQLRPWSSREVLSDGPFFRVTFKSNYLYDGHGFRAQYSFIGLPSVPKLAPNDFRALPSTNKIRITWRKPETTLSGEVLGYEIRYGTSPNSMTSLKVEDPDTTKITLVNLKPNTKYTVVTSLYNSVGNGPETTIDVRTLEEEYTCNKNIDSRTQRNGTITSPMHPEAYPAETTCRYIFTGVGRERIQLEFKHIDLHYRNGNPAEPIDCKGYDSVSVIDIVRGQTIELGTWCGRKLPPMLMSSQPKLIVEFRSYHSRPEVTKVTGFLAQYNFVTDFGIKGGEQDNRGKCMFEYRSSVNSTGEIWSPNYPGHYPRSTECQYLFYGRDEEKIRIEFQEFDVDGISPGCDASTMSDYVSFSNFADAEDRKMERLCGQLGPWSSGEVLSDGPFFRVTFKSNHLYDRNGFRAQYSFVEQPSVPKLAPSDFRALPSANKIRMTWRKPKTTLSGEVLGYEIRYGTSPSSMSSLKVEDPDTTKITLIDMKPNTKYTVVINFYNSVGNGPETTIDVRTLGGGDKNDTVDNRGGNDTLPGNCRDCTGNESNNGEEMGSDTRVTTLRHPLELDFQQILAPLRAMIARRESAQMDLKMKWARLNTEFRRKMNALFARDQSQ